MPHIFGLSSIKAVAGNAAHHLCGKRWPQQFNRGEAKRRGWQNWNLDYIQERDKGWMHIVIADVTRKNAVNVCLNP